MSHVFVQMCWECVQNVCKSVENVCHVVKNVCECVENVFNMCSKYAQMTRNCVSKKCADASKMCVHVTCGERDRPHVERGTDHM